MSVLTREKILKLIRKGKVRIEPYDEALVGPASIDLRLGNEFRKFKKGSAITINDSTKHDDYTIPITAEEIEVKPGEFIHGITVEKITLPENVCGFLYGRSKYARMGIMIHATASFIQPGICNKQVLEIKNISPRKLILQHGVRLCQLILMDTKGKAKYDGRFKNQVKV